MNFFLGCEQLVCSINKSCINGFCIATTNSCTPTQPCPNGLICQSNLCVIDPCLNKCPNDHICINNGECRLIQGIYCTTTENDSGNCPPPFECVNGVCVKDGLILFF